MEYGICYILNFNNPLQCRTFPWGFAIMEYFLQYAVATFTLEKNMNTSTAPDKNLRYVVQNVDHVQINHKAHSAVLPSQNMLPQMFSTT